METPIKMAVHKFKGQLLRAEDPGSWTHIVVPIDAAAIFGSNGFIAVKRSIDGYAFSGLKLAPAGHDVHRLSINNKIREAIGRASGDWVGLELEPDMALKEVVVPDDFLMVLQDNETAMVFFETLTDSYKRYYTKWIIGAKKEDTRISRIKRGGGKT
jgi:hypothetical protein